MLSGKKIAVIGAGTMGRSIVAGLLASGKVRRGDLAATDSSKASARSPEAERGIRCGLDNAAAAAGADVVLLCVKPRDTGKAAESIRGSLRGGRRKLVVSIAAGVTTGLLEEALGGRARRFKPTCSHYGESVVREFGVVRGGWMAIRRVLRCGPWTPMGTEDPPPVKAAKVQANSLRPSSFSSTQHA